MRSGIRGCEVHCTCDSRTGRGIGFDLGEKGADPCRYLPRYMARARSRFWS